MTARAAMPTRVDEALLRELSRSGVRKPPLEYEKAHTYPASQPFFEELSAASALSPLPSVSSPFWAYVHVPFCHYACSFCFYKKTLSPALSRLYPAYFGGLEQEFAHVRTLLDGERIEVHDLYIGGGTPTALTIAQLEALLDLVESNQIRTPDFLGTCEASPESITTEKALLLRERGIHRISLGAQSLDQSHLDFSNRQHRVRQILDAHDVLRGAGCDHLNIDLIYGFPGQTIAAWERELRAALSHMLPESLTLYYLRYVPGTPLARHAASPDRVSWADLATMRQVYFAVLAEAGYEMCRPHHFRLPSDRIRRYRGAPTLDHGNVGSQIGFGPSAYTHLGAVVSRSAWPISRWQTRIEEQGFGTAEGRALTEADRLTRAAVKTLIGSHGLERDAFEKATGRSLEDVYGVRLERLVELGLLVESAQGYELTGLGLLLDEEVAYFLYIEGFQQGEACSAVSGDTARRNPQRVGSGGKVS